MTPLVRTLASGSTVAKCLASAVSATPATRVASAAIKSTGRCSRGLDAAYAPLQPISDT